MIERHVFAYAYNLNEIHLAEQGIEPVERTSAVLKNHTVVFNAVSSWFPGRAGATLQRRHASHVEGAVYRLSAEALELFDHTEHGYHREGTPVSCTYAAKVLASGRGLWTPEYQQNMRRKLHRRGISSSG